MTCVYRDVKGRQGTVERTYDAERVGEHDADVGRIRVVAQSNGDDADAEDKEVAEQVHAHAEPALYNNRDEVRLRDDMSGRPLLKASAQHTLFSESSFFSLSLMNRVSAR